MQILYIQLPNSSSGELLHLLRVERIDPEHLHCICSNVNEAVVTINVPFTIRATMQVHVLVLVLSLAQCFLNSAYVYRLVQRFSNFEKNKEQTEQKEAL